MQILAKIEVSDVILFDTKQIFAATLITAQDVFNELPVNTAGIIGQNVTLNCAVSNKYYSLQWVNPDSDVVYRKASGVTSGNEEYYVVEENGNSHNLVVLDAAEDDAEQYKCKVHLSAAFAQVILLGNVNIFTDY